MKLKQLEILLAIEQEKGLLGAAAKMNISGPAVAKSVASLEDYFGVELLDRSGYRTVLNQYGAKLAQHSKIISAEIEGAKNNLKSMKDQTENLIRVNASPAVLPRLLPEAIVRLRTELPQANLSFEGHLVGHAQQKLDGLLKGDYDLLINVVEESNDLSGFQYEKLVYMQLKVIASKGHPITRVKHPTLNHVCQHVCIVPGAMEGLPYQTMKRVFSDNNLPVPAQILSFPTREMVFSVLEKGPYIAMLPYHEKLFEGNQDTVQIVDVAGVNHGWPLYLLKRKSMIDTIPIQKFTQVVKSLVNDLAAS